MYGEIIKIEINYRRGYAFIRYKLVKSASVAYEKSKNKEFNGKKFRMLYSDSGKRNGIIDDWIIIDRQRFFNVILSNNKIFIQILY